MRKILVVGGGSIGHRHVRCLLRTGRAQVSLCDNRPEILADLRAKYELQAVFDDFDSVDLHEFDGVVITTPANLHVPMSRRVVAAGVNLMCEKPLCVTDAGVAELIREAEDAGLVAGVAYTHRYIPGIVELKRMIEAGTIGSVKHVAYRSGQHFPTFRPAYREIYFADPAMGGGAILDAASHLVSSITWLAGPVERLTGSYDHLGLPDVPVEDTVDAVLQLQGGTMANLHVNLFGRPTELLLTVLGENGAVRYDGTRGIVGICEEFDGPWQERDFAAERDVNYVAEAENFLNAIEGREPVRCTLPEAYHINQVCWAIRRAADEQRWVGVR